MPKFPARQRLIMKHSEIYDRGEGWEEVGGEWKGSFPSFNTKPKGFGAQMVSVVILDKPRDKDHGQGNQLPSLTVWNMHFIAVLLLILLRDVPVTSICCPY